MLALELHRTSCYCNYYAKWKIYWYILQWSATPAVACLILILFAFVPNSYYSSTLDAHAIVKVQHECVCKWLHQLKYLLKLKMWGWSSYVFLRGEGIRVHRNPCACEMVCECVWLPSCCVWLPLNYFIKGFKSNMGLIRVCVLQWHSKIFLC